MNWKTNFRTVLRLCLVGSAVVSGAAHADWQYTKWGMTSDEVVAASKGVATASGEKPFEMDNNITSKLIAPYSAGGIDFDTYFLFDASGKLVKVHLGTKDFSNCDAIFGALSSKYGQPDRAERLGGITMSTFWRDKDSGNLVAFVRVLVGKRACMIKYSALENNVSKGL